MWDRRRIIVAVVAVSPAMAMTAGLLLTSRRKSAVTPAAGSRVLSPFSGEPVTALGQHRLA